MRLHAEIPRMQTVHGMTHWYRAQHSACAMVALSVLRCARHGRQAAEDHEATGLSHPIIGWMQTMVNSSVVVRCA
jgi:hypothetical protein